jgi:predicted ABC-type ATPase
MLLFRRIRGEKVSICLSCGQLDACIIYLRLPSTRLALRRIAARVKQGGHNVPPVDVLRRFSRGWDNFQNTYRSLADAWAVYDNSGDGPRLLGQSP